MLPAIVFAISLALSLLLGYHTIMYVLDLVYSSDRYVKTSRIRIISLASGCVVFWSLLFYLLH